MIFASAVLTALRGSASLAAAGVYSTLRDMSVEYRR